MWVNSMSGMRGSIVEEVVVVIRKLQEERVKLNTNTMMVVNKRDWDMGAGTLAKTRMMRRLMPPQKKTSNAPQLHGKLVQGRPSSVCRPWARRGIQVYTRVNVFDDE